MVCAGSSEKLPPIATSAARRGITEPTSGEVGSHKKRKEDGFCLAGL
jgi:hypothetical protein